MEMLRPHSIMFHHFHKEGSKPFGQGSITAERFDKIIQKLRNKYNLLSAKIWLEKAVSDKLEKDDICLSFDDNLLNQYEVAIPILESYSLTGFWFVYSSPLTRVLEKLELYRYFRCTMFNDINQFYKEFDKYVLKLFDETGITQKNIKFDPNNYLSAFPFYSLEDKRFRYIRDEVLGELNYNNIMDLMIKNSKLNLSEVSKTIWFDSSVIKSLSQSGHVIGLHSHSHPTRLNQLSYENQYEEYMTNYRILTEITGEKIFVAAHPTNSYNNDTFRVFKELGIKIGFRSTMEKGFKSKFEFPRLDQALII